MASAMIITTTDIVLLMEVTAVAHVLTKNFVQNVNVKLDKLEKSQMQREEMVSAMMKLTLQAATLMVGTAVDSALTQSTVLTVNVRERTMVL